MRWTSCSLFEKIRSPTTLRKDSRCLHSTLPKFPNLQHFTTLKWPKASIFTDLKAPGSIISNTLTHHISPFPFRFSSGLIRCFGSTSLGRVERCRGAQVICSTLWVAKGRRCLVEVGWWMEMAGEVDMGKWWKMWKCWGFFWKDLRSWRLLVIRGWCDMFVQIRVFFLKGSRTQLDWLDDQCRTHWPLHKKGCFHFDCGSCRFSTIMFYSAVDWWLPHCEVWRLVYFLQQKMDNTWQHRCRVWLSPKELLRSSQQAPVTDRETLTATQRPLRPQLMLAPN